MALSFNVERAARVAWKNIGFLCVAAVLIYCVVHAFDPPRLNWGDSMSDYNVMTSGRNFQKYGFLKLRLTPLLMDPAYTRSFEQMFVYTHYPQLPDLMNGALRVFLGMQSLTQFRLVALAFSFSALFFTYKLLVFYWGRPTAQVGLALWVVNPLWIQHADYLHHAPYASFFGFGSIYWLTRSLRENRRGLLAASGVFLFFTVLSSYDYWFFAPLLLAMAAIAHHRTVAPWALVRTLSILAACAIAGLAVKLGTNAWALGGIDPWLSDLRFQFTERATDRITRTSYRLGIVPTAYGRVERFFTLLLIPAGVFWALVPVLGRKWKISFFETARTVPNPWMLFIAAFPFLYLFTEIWVAQYYPGLLVLPFYAVAMAAIIALLSANNATRRVAVFLFSALLLNSLYEDLRFKKAYFDMATIRTMGAQLDSVAGPGQQLLINHVFDAPYRYYFNRNTLAAVLFPPRVADVGLESYADIRRHPRSAGPEGAIFVQHKHVKDELYDKGYYYIFSRLRLWALWGNPEKHRELVDEMIEERDSTLMAHVTRMGQKLYDAPTYAIWRIPPTAKAISDAAQTPGR
jgi:hypothetical protein